MFSRILPYLLLLIASVCALADQDAGGAATTTKVTQTTVWATGTDSLGNLVTTQSIFTQSFVTTYTAATGTVPAGSVGLGSIDGNVGKVRTYPQSTVSANGAATLFKQAYAGSQTRLPYTFTLSIMLMSTLCIFIIFL